jgi:hypothetical protein
LTSIAILHLKKMTIRINMQVRVVRHVFQQMINIKSSLEADARLGKWCTLRRCSSIVEQYASFICTPLCVITGAPWLAHIEHSRTAPGQGHAHLKLLVACGVLNRQDTTVLDYNNVLK